MDKYYRTYQLTSTVAGLVDDPSFSSQKQSKFKENAVSRGGWGVVD